MKRLSNSFLAFNFQKRKMLINRSYFSTQGYTEPEDMAEFYRAIKLKMSKMKEEEDPNPTNLRDIWKVKNTIAWSLSTFILINNGNEYHK
jgi:hypothetical protein